MQDTDKELLESQFQLIQDLQTRLQEYEDGLWAVWLVDEFGKPSELVGIYPQLAQANSEAAQWDRAGVRAWRMHHKSMCLVWGKT